MSYRAWCGVLVAAAIAAFVRSACADPVYGPVTVRRCVDAGDITVHMLAVDGQTTAIRVSGLDDDEADIDCDLVADGRTVVRDYSASRACVLYYAPDSPTSWQVVRVRVTSDSAVCYQLRAW